MHRVSVTNFRYCRRLIRSFSEPSSPTTAAQLRPGSTSSSIINLIDDEDEPEIHDFMEFFSPPRVAVALRREQMCAKHSFDLETGYDFLTCEDRAQALRLWQTHRPFFTMLSPPCTMYSSMQNLNLAKMDPDVKQKRFNEAHCLLDFAMMIAQRQMQRFKFFCHEHPQKASSWQRHTVQAVAALPGVMSVTFDQCQVGLKTPVSQQPLRKRTTLLTNSPQIVEVFAPLQCQCEVEHAVIQGSEGGISLSKHCQIYTPEFVEKLVEGVKRTLAATGQL